MTRRVLRLLVALLLPLLALQILLVACARDDTFALSHPFSGITATPGGPTSAPSTPATTVTTSATPPNSADLTSRVIALTNADRAANGCPALSVNAILMGTAQAHSQDMALHDFVGHQSADGTSPWDRIKAAGYNYQLVAENISWGTTSPDAVVASWFNETPPNDLHRKNILNCNLRDVGAGYYYLADDPGQVTAHAYWTEDFGTPLHT